MRIIILIMLAIILITCYANMFFKILIDLHKHNPTWGDVIRAFGLILACIFCGLALSQSFRTIL